MDLQERVARLERQNRLWRGIGLTLFGVVLCGASFQQVAGQAKKQQKEVVADRFVVRGENKKTAAVLEHTKDGTQLIMYDNKGQSRVLLRVVEKGTSGSGLVLKSSAGKVRSALVEEGEPGGRLLFTDKDGKPLVSFGRPETATDLDMGADMDNNESPPETPEEAAKTLDALDNSESPKNSDSSKLK